MGVVRIYRTRLRTRGRRSRERAATRCLAVGGDGIAVLTGANGSWTASVRHTRDTSFSGHQTNAISCPSPAGCYTTALAWLNVAFGTYQPIPAIMPLSPDGVPGPVQALSDRGQNLYTISCVADGVCTLVGDDNPPMQGLVIDMRPATPPVATLWPNTIRFTGVSCTTATSCGITGTQAGTHVPVFAWRS